MGNSIIVSKEEYEYLISQLNNFTTIKNNILAFSFLLYHLQHEYLITDWLLLI